MASSDYDSTYDSTYETNHSDSSDFAQNEEEGDGGKKSAEGRDYLAGGIVLHPLLPSPEVGGDSQRTPSQSDVCLDAFFFFCPLAGKTNFGPGTKGDARPGTSHGSTEQLELSHFQPGGEDSRRDRLHPQSGGPAPKEITNVLGF